MLKRRQSRFGRRSDDISVILTSIEISALKRFVTTWLGGCIRRVAINPVLPGANFSVKRQLLLLAVAGIIILLC